MFEKTKIAINGLLPISPTARNVGVLATGTAISQAIPIAISPILTRLYTPEEFGAIGLYMAFVAVLSVIATGRYELAIPLTATEEEAASIAIFTLKLCATVSALLYAPIIAFDDFIVQAIGNQDLKVWLYLLPLTVLATGAYNTFQFYYNRSGRYRQMAENRVQNSAFTSLSNLLLGIGHVKGGMILGGTIGQTVAALLIGRGVWRWNKSTISKSDWGKQRQVANRFINHPKHIAPAQLLGAVAQQIPIFLVGSLFSLTTAGFFSLAYRTVSIPSTLIANAIGDVYRQRIAVAHRENGEFRGIFTRTLRTTALISLPPFVILYVSAPSLFEYVYGATWRIAGEYAQILILASFFQFVLTPLDKGAVVMGATKYIFYWQLTRFIGGLMLIVTAHLNHMSISAVLWSITSLSLFMYLLDGVIEFHLSGGKNDKR